MIRNTLKCGFRWLPASARDLIREGLAFGRFGLVRLTPALRRNVLSMATIFRDRRDAYDILKSHSVPRERELKKRFGCTVLATEPDTFVLYRILGNDLIPRHARGQTHSNLAFILKNEPDLDGCDKCWVVNRIIDYKEEAAIIALLKEHRQTYLRVPFEQDKYQKQPWDFEALPKPGYLSSLDYRFLSDQQKASLLGALYRHKNNYVMNNNGARNTALEDGRGRAKWILPWDGNCFVTTRAWNDICDAVRNRPYLPYFLVPMARITNNDHVHADTDLPKPNEEPQVIFRKDAPEAFNEEFCYGRRPKVELFWRLSVPGPWKYWRDKPWDQPRRPGAEQAGQFGVAGHVVRLNSGVKTLEQADKTSFTNRGEARQEAIIETIFRLDQQLVDGQTDAKHGVFFLKDAIERFARVTKSKGQKAEQSLIQTILKDADDALTAGPYSVLDKRTLAPSGNPKDYWHPAPYYWPNPKTANGLPYIKRDGRRSPGTVMYEAESVNYDRTHLQLMFDGTVSLGLAWRLTGKDEFCKRAALYIRTWFIDSETAMNPHLKYSQVRRGHNRDKGSASGLIEFKDFYYFLEAVSWIERSGALSVADIATFKEWLTRYQEWLETSEQGQKEVISENNHGTYFDLQTAAIARYLDDRTRLRDILLRAISRIPQQFKSNGEQPHEMTRTITQHYCYFNLQGWLNLLLVARSSSIIRVEFHEEPYLRIAKAVEWIADHDVEIWPFKQIEPFDTDRIVPLLHTARRLKIPLAKDLPKGLSLLRNTDVKARFSPHDAVYPYWIINAILDNGNHPRKPLG